MQAILAKQENEGKANLPLTREELYLQAATPR